MIKLLHGDCLKRMAELEAESVDMVLADPPYGTTACAWDTVIPFEPMWEQLKRIVKSNGAIVMTASQPFTTTLIASNMKMFKYCWVWQKERGTNFFQAKFAPLNNTEDVVVFSGGGCNNGTKNPMPYAPQGVSKSSRTMKNSASVGGGVGINKGTPALYGKSYTQEASGYPTKILKFSAPRKGGHPTQKPVALMEYLIRTYTQEGETVLDFTMGSGTTGVAAIKHGRSFIGIELDKGYFELANKRILQAKQSRGLLNYMEATNG